MFSFFLARDARAVVVTVLRSPWSWVAILYIGIIAFSSFSSSILLASTDQIFALSKYFPFFSFSLARGRVWPGLPVLSYLVCHNGLYAMTKIKGNHLLESWLGCRKSITRREQPSRVTFRGNCKTWQKSGESFGTASSFAHNFPTPWLGGGWRRKKICSLSSPTVHSLENLFASPEVQVLS